MSKNITHWVLTWQKTFFDGTLTAYNFGQNGQSWNFFGPIIKPVKSRFWGKKKFGISTFFARVPGQNVSLTPNLH